MAIPYTDPTMGELLRPQRMSIRAARERFGALVDRVASGTCVRLCRRLTPLAVMIPADDCDRVAETCRGEKELAASRRGRGLDVEPWTESSVMEGVMRLDGRQG